MEITNNVAKLLVELSQSQDPGERVSGSNLSENSCAIIGDSDIAVGGDQNLIKTTGTLKNGDYKQRRKASCRTLSVSG
jgi:hypothetical protein